MYTYSVKIPKLLIVSIKHIDVEYNRYYPPNHHFTNLIFLQVNKIKVPHKSLDGRTAITDNKVSK